MSISFNRNRAQVLFERFIGVSSPEELKENRNNFKCHVLSSDEATLLKDALDKDAVDFFYNGILSFSEGIDAVFQKRFSWATVELYYSVYYLIRASLATKNIAILRCFSMYRLPARAGEKPYGTGNKKYNTTHEGTINHYQDVFSLSDKLLSNNIEDNDAYEWMMNAREIVNYRCTSFLEPDCLEIWDYFSQCVNDGTLATTLSNLEKDPYVMCFQEEYAVVAIPIKRMQETIADMVTYGLIGNLEDQRELFAKSVIDYDRRSLSILSQVFT
ncbi:hypothetical protein [Caproicibacter fermentans]|uniref:hypothetical protein n=1 Tax=Caproicibacter fermentans TaxID=2576756 RepID=UPI0012ECF628|nr:hypothetical protein [Caproicibacter fermentans]